MNAPELEQSQSLALALLSSLAMTRDSVLALAPDSPQARLLLKAYEAKGAAFLAVVTRIRHTHDDSNLRATLAAFGHCAKEGKL